jgi:hypothetical protein
MVGGTVAEGTARGTTDAVGGTRERTAEVVGRGSAGCMMGRAVGSTTEAAGERGGGTREGTEGG